jgi:hypothetical protein
MTGFSLSDLAVRARIKTLISLTQYGPIFPCFGVGLLNSTWSCECGDPACLKSAGKHPHITTSWRTAATKDPAQIAEWAEQWPLANWAIATGIDIDVVDLDVKPGKPSGVVTLACWEDCDSVTTPDSTRVTTGTGRHIYFPAGSGLKSTSNPDGTGIDVKSTGGYVMAPGSRHANGEVYQIDLDEGLEPCPAWLVARISVQNRPFRINRVTLPIHNKEEGPQRFQIRPDSELTQDERARINILRDRLPKFASTWVVERATSLWPFKDGRNSPSEYEASIAFFLVWDGWDEQSIMDAICVWRRECGLEAPSQYSRYAITIGKAVAMVTPRSKGLGDTRKESKGLYKHGYTRDHILSCIIETPRTPQQISDITGIDLPHVKVVIGRLHKEGKVIRDNHTYLCAPHGVPGHLRNIPDDAGEDIEVELATPEEAEVDLDWLDAEYQAWVSAGGLEAIEEAMAPSEDVILGLVDPIKATDEVLDPLDLSVYFNKMMDSMQKTRLETMWETYGNTPSPSPKKKQKKKQSYARLPAGSLDPNGDRLKELEAERGILEPA